MKIIYYAPYSFSLIKSLPLNMAPRIRQYQIYHALKKKHNIYCISGDYQERKEAINKFLDTENIEDFDGMYCESASWPLRNLDYMFFKFCHSNIPMTIFYRDCFWKTKEYFKKVNLQVIQSYVRFHFEFLIFRKYFDHFFVPTESFGNFCKFKKKSILPPAGLIKTQKNKYRKWRPFNIIFAGNAKAGYEIIFKIMEILNSESEDIHLHVISDDIPKASVKNVFYHRTSFDNCKLILNKSHIGINVLRKTKYYNLALPLKLFDYLSWGLPIVATNTYEMKKFINSNEVGLTVEHNEKAFAKAILNLKNNKKIYNKFQENALRIITESHNWDKRVNTIVDKIREIHNYTNTN